MPENQEQRARTLFMQLVGLPQEERGEALARACGNDQKLRAEVESLLAADRSAGAFLTGPAGQKPAPGPVRQDSPQVAGEHIGRYRLLEQIGEGGMGTIWMAEQREPVKRRVALKVIKLGMDTRQVIARFEAERQALAMMDHPNIAKVLDAGSTEAGRPYFVMEYIRGVPILEYCDREKLDTEARLGLFVEVCHAIQHAHQKGIIHRDIKPNNVLVTLHDGVPVPKVIDFGIAKATNSELTAKTLFTEHRQMIGTPAYMSPEQAEMSGLDIDTRSDIYSLGVLLYELLTGTTPFDMKALLESGFQEMLRAIREDEPQKPSTRISSLGDTGLRTAQQRRVDLRQLSGLLRGDLDWIVMKALEKDRTRRYETANGLSRDIERFLHDDVVEACPPSAAYRFKKLLRRNKGQFLAAGLVLLTLIAGTAAVLAVQARANDDLQAVNADLDQANNELKSSNALLDQQRARAEAREQQAIDAVRRFRDAVADNGALKNNPELDSLRKTLLKEPLAFFKTLREQLQADSDTRPEALARLASAAFELGLLTNEIGDKEDALRIHQEALAIWERLTSENPTVTAYAKALANSHEFLGRLHSEMGRAEAAEASCLGAIAILERLASENPTDINSANDLAASHNSLAQLQGSTGRVEAARTSNDRAISIFERLARENPTSPLIAKNLAMSLGVCGGLQLRTGAAEAAEASYARANLILERLARENPTAPNFAEGLAGSHFELATVQLKTGRIDLAEASYGRAIEILERLARENPTVTEFATRLAGGHIKLGLFLNQTGRASSAEASFGRAISIYERLAREHSTVTAFARGVADSYLSLGLVQRQTGRAEAAESSYSRASSIYERLARENPTTTLFADSLAASHHNLGSLQRRTGKDEAAMVSFGRAIAISERLARESPDVTEFAKALADSHDSLGIVQGQLGDVRAAEASHGRALEIHRRLALQHPESPDFACAMGAALHNLALIDTMERRFNEARNRLVEAVEWQRKALAANPRHPTYREFLTNHLNFLIVVGRDLDDPEGIAEAQRQLAELQATDPSFEVVDARLNAVAKGEAPRDNAERLALAQRAYDTRRFALAARLFGEALESDPKLADDRNAQHRYNSACAASLAAAGQGQNEPPLDDEARTVLRNKTLDWLTAELATWSALLESGSPEAKAPIAETLKHWQQDSDLAGVRAADELAKHPDSERAAWELLWEKVNELLTQASAEAKSR